MVSIRNTRFMFGLYFGGTVVERTGSEVGERRRWDQEGSWARTQTRDAWSATAPHVRALPTRASGPTNKWDCLQKTLNIQVFYYSSKWIKSLESIHQKDLFTHLFNDCFFRFYCYTRRWQQLSIFFTTFFAVISIVQLERRQEVKWEREGVGSGKDCEPRLKLGSPEAQLRRVSGVLPTRPSTPAQMSILCVMSHYLLTTKQPDSFESLFFSTNDQKSVSFTCIFQIVCMILPS